MIRKLYLLPVRFYKRFISPAICPDCIYTPTCSSYFIQAVEKFGIIRGTIMGFARILRCSKHYLGGEDPVPDTWSFIEIREKFTFFRRKLRK